MVPRRITKRSRNRQRRVKRSKRKTFRQRGGGPKPLIDESSNAPAINTNGQQIDFNVRFQPSVKAREDGPTFTSYQTAHEPYPVWTAPTPPTMYCILCWDPDATSKSFLHWLIVNCTTADNSDGKVLAPWLPPSPPPGSGEHRYILGLFAQTGRIDKPEITDRTNFNPSNFAKENGMTALAYRGFRVVAADAPPPPEANPSSAVPVPAIPPLQNNTPAV